jgi:hypothetical protein
LLQYFPWILRYEDDRETLTRKLYHFVGDVPPKNVTDLLTYFTIYEPEGIPPFYYE